MIDHFLDYYNFRLYVIPTNDRFSKHTKFKSTVITHIMIRYIKSLFFVKKKLDLHQITKAYIHTHIFFIAKTLLAIVEIFI